MTAATTERSLLMVVNELRWFWTHRLPLAQEARRRGWRVEVVSPPSEYLARVEAAGFPVHPVLQPRADNSPLGQLRNVTALVRLYRRFRPTVVHHVTVKPVLFGSIAARIAGVPAVVNAVAGLGFVFMSDERRARAIRAVVLPLLRAALAHPRQRVVFQNADDRNAFLALRLVRARDTIVIRGAGVDPDVFRPRPVPDGVPVVLLPARLLRDKGVTELVEAARLLKARGVACRVVLRGEPDPGNPTSVTPGEVASWTREGIVETPGHSDDMALEMSRATIVALPSYREGLPKALLEAASMGRPIVTTDVPGCREVVHDGVNGLLVPPRDPAALARALEQLLGDEAMCARMGEAGRAMVLRDFSVARIAGETVRLYEELCDQDRHAG